LADYEEKAAIPEKPVEKYPVVVETKDRIAVDVWANIESLQDISLLHTSHVGGVGLLRSEFFSSKNGVECFSEEDQMALYGEILKKVDHLPLYFRVFDVGGDKNFSSMSGLDSNPALGCRSLRFLLRYREIFIRQIRALLKVMGTRDIHLLLPLVTDLPELLEAKALIYEVAESLKEEGFQVSQNIKIGSMIEIPSAVLLSDQIAKESDFFSIGTNDLVQYTLAADRSHADLYSPAHPSILRMIQMVVKSARHYSIPVSICGEIASNPLFTPLLIGLGIRHFSCPLRYIPLIKERILQLSIPEAEKIAATALIHTSGAEVSRFLTDAYVLN
jgi:phosphotransferase system enzyme I (PtsI)